MGGGLFEKKVKKRIIKIIVLKVKNKLARFKIIYKNMYLRIMLCYFSAVYLFMIDIYIFYF